MPEISLVDHIKSEITAIKTLLADLPSDRVIERIGLESREKKLKNELEKALEVEGFKFS